MRSIELQEVSRVYGRTFALQRISLRLMAGSSTGLIGGNGAGKTTLLNILATLDTPTQGTIMYDALNWHEFAARGRQFVGWVSHAPLLYKNLTGQENLYFFAKMYGLDAIQERSSQWLKRVGLQDAGTKRVSDYSRGMVQRLTIARALLHDPNLILLDEPLTGLDRQGRLDMITLFLELKARGKIVLMSTHDLHALGSLCDQIIVLKQGRLMCHKSIQNHKEVLKAYETHA